MSIIEDFKKFALRGNLIDLAIGFTVGAAFTTVAKSLVDDLLMPPIGLLLGRADFGDLYLVMRDGLEKAAPYASLADAQASGAVTLNYGRFINSAITLLIVAFAMFMFIKVVNRLDSLMERDARGKAVPPPDEPSSKKCPHCLSTIAYRATRCPQCTSELAAPASS